MAEARFAQRHERALLDPAAEVSGLGVAHNLARVADRLQIAGDDVVERRSLLAGDLDDAVARRRERHISDVGGNIVCRDGLEQAGRQPDNVSIRTFLGEAATTSWPPWRRMATVFEPIRPVPPMTTIFMVYSPLSMTGDPQTGSNASEEDIRASTRARKANP